MNAPEAIPSSTVRIDELPNAIGAPFAGGHFFGIYRHGEQLRALAVLPKAYEFEGIYQQEEHVIEGALSYYDGLANTIAMAEAGSEVAKKVLAAQIEGCAGCNDHHIPARDQLELMLRHGKPTAQENYCWFRSGDNPSSVPPGYPYTPSEPGQTTIEAFKEGGAEAFEAGWYWSSTQFAGYGDSAWAQTFHNGNQRYIRKRTELRVRLVRSILVI